MNRWITLPHRVLIRRHEFGSHRHPVAACRGQDHHRPPIPHRTRGTPAHDLLQPLTFLISFGGSNTKPENIGPLYWEVNQHDMTVAEDDVADRLNRGERVYYYVEAVYRDGVNDEYILDSVNIYV